MARRSIRKLDLRAPDVIAEERAACQAWTRYRAPHTITVLITADTSQFEAALARIDKATRRLTKTHWWYRFLYSVAGCR